MIRIKKIDIDVLDIIYKSDSGVSTAEIIEAIAKSKSTASRSLNELENKGYILKKTIKKKDYYFKNEDKEADVLKIIEVQEAWNR